jgi:undecaprenyl-diphosphatase
VPPDLLWKAALLGLVEGATEFLPVSSTGHLILVSNWLHLVDERAKTFDIFIQLGAILAVVWLYRSRLMHVVSAITRDVGSRKFVLNQVIAFLPAALIGLLAHDWIKAHLFNSAVVVVALIAGGLAILLIEHWSPRSTIHDVNQVPPTTALGIGLAQVLSLVPGTSRSGATIMGGYALGLSRVTATEFSFFLAIPVMLAATGYDLLKSRSTLLASDIPMFAVGLVVSFISAMFVVRALLRYVSGHSFRVFAWYRILLGVLLLITGV